MDNKELTLKVLNNMLKAVLEIENGVSYLEINRTQLSDESIRKQYVNILQRLENLLYLKSTEV
jgi:hypothetical protein